MKPIIFALTLFFASSFTIAPKETASVLYQYEKGKLSVQKDFLQLNFDINYYYRGEGDFIEILVMGEEKKYLGSVDESTYKNNRAQLINQYNAELTKIFDDYDYSDKMLRVERRNKKCYFYYYDHLSYVQVGRLLKDGRYCVGAHNYQFQVRESRILVALYLNGELKYGEKLYRDNNYKIVARKDFKLEHLKTIP